MKGLSFAARLLAALLGVVMLVVGVMLVMVQRETSVQVALATDRAAAVSNRLFREVEDLQRIQLVRLGRTFTASQRTLAALEAALESGEPEWLVHTSRYEFDLAGIQSGLAIFTDDEGQPVVSLIDGESATGDPAGITQLARVVLARGEQATGYRLVGERLFTVKTDPIELGGRWLGTVTFGLPLEADVPERLGQAAGAEVCLVAGTRCVSGTPAARASLAHLMTRSGGVRRAVADGRRWVVWSEVLPESGSPGISRVIALPIDEVLAPFDRIRAALAWTGLGTLGLAALIGLLLARRLTRPVRELVAATARVADGDLTARVTVPGRDELGVLAHAFNTMTEGLELKERYRSVLHKVVSREIAEDLLASDLRLGGETREVTTLFADIVGFTALTEGMDPARVIAILNECMTALGASVETEGGVVDKYTGDGVMAIFGAPVSHGNDAQRAVRAAQRMQASMQELNARRQSRGEPRIELAIGVHTGGVVAGNMGSPDRLNYTVLGESVNLAARLCKEAGAGEILVSEETARRVRDVVPVTARGELHVRGFSKPIPVGVVENPVEPALHGGAGHGSRLILGLLALLTAAAPLHAQDRPPGLPTLAGLGLGWVSPSGGLQLDLSGRLDLEFYLPQDSPAWLIPTTDPFVAGRVRVFADVFAGRAVYGLLELRADRGETPADRPVDVRIEQAFLRVRPSQRASVQLQAGKFATPLGSYAQRHHTPADPLVRPPLAYEYRTLATPAVVPGNTAGFLNWKNEATERRPRGAPQLWNVAYPWGAVVSASAGNAVLRVAALSAAPSSAPSTWSFDLDRFERPTFVAGLSFQVVPELRLAGTYGRGPWLEAPTGPLPDGADTRDFNQEIAALEAVFSRGHLTLRGEAFLNRWEIPNLRADPSDVSYYLEGSLRIATGLTLAARWNEIRFDSFAPEADAARERWDFDARRIQVGAGYRIVHNAGIRVEHSLNRTLGTRDPRDDLFAIQVWWAF